MHRQPWLRLCVSPTLHGSIERKRIDYKRYERWPSFNVGRLRLLMVRIHSVTSIQNFFGTCFQMGENPEENIPFDISYLVRIECVSDSIRERIHIHIPMCICHILRYKTVPRATCTEQSAN